MFEGRVWGRASEWPFGTSAEPVHVERTGEKPMLYCINWHLSGLGDACLAVPGICVEHVADGDRCFQRIERTAAVLVYVDRLDDRARPEIERWMSFPVMVLSRAVEGDDAVWAMRAGVRDIIVVPRELPYLTDRLKQICSYLRSEESVAWSDNSRLSRSGGISALRTRLALREIELRFRDRLTVPALAAMCNMTTITFMRTFKRENGSTVLAYLNRYRIATAKQRLAEPSTSIKEIALSCGFDDISYFSRVFRKFEGVPPTVYRDRFQK